MKELIALFLVVGIVSCSAGEEMSGTAKIYYIPIGMATYVPITKEKIADHHFSYGEQEVSASKFKELLKLIENAENGSFDGQIVRVKIVLPNADSIYIDNEGGIESAGKQLALSDSELQNAKELLDEMTERVLARR